MVETSPQASMPQDRPPLVEVRGLGRTFKGVTALSDVSFALDHGEVLALVGSNGAGKSTLIKVLSGVYPPSDGELLIGGTPVRLRDPADARQRGIETLYQDLSLIDTLDAAGNIFLGRERRTRLSLNRLLDTRAMNRDAMDLLTALNPSVPLNRPVSFMSGGQRQAVSLARAVHFGARVIILDEPTAALGVAETALTLAAIRQFRSQGRSVILVSHDLIDVFEVADRILVLRAGRVVGTRVTCDTTTEEIVQMITVGESDSSRQVDLSRAGDGRR